MFIRGDGLPALKSVIDTLDWHIASDVERDPRCNAGVIVIKVFCLGGSLANVKNPAKPDFRAVVLILSLT